MCLALLVRGEVGRALQACGPGAELWLGAAELWSGVGRVHAKADGIPKAWSSLLGADPNRYRHSPERLKKGSQDDVSTHVHQGRRQSGKAGLCGHRGFFSGPLTKWGTNLLQQHLGLALTSLEIPGRVEGPGVSVVWMGTSGASCLPPGISDTFLPTQGWTALLLQGPRKACSGHPFLAPPQLTPSSFATWNTGS